MRNIYNSIKEISTSCKDVDVLFSTGKDSTVMLDLFMDQAKGSVGRVVFMYFCPDLSFEEKILRYQEQRYKIQITRIPHPDTALLLNRRTNKRRVGISQLEKYLRAEGADWIAYGFRKDESLQRRGQLTQAPNGIDAKYRKLFPLSEWSAKHINAYIRQNKLMIPTGYAVGFRDINSFKGEALLYIYNNYPEDYEKIISVFPDVEGELIRLRGQSE